MCFERGQWRGRPSWRHGRTIIDCQNPPSLEPPRTRTILMARPHASRARTPRAPARWPRRVCTVSLITFGQSNTSVWRVRAPLLARAHGRASARWPWRVRAVALGALGPTIGRSARPRHSDRASLRAY
ncbi:hypothetical protein PIB30_082442 [Stylosanthes scabra]|uniref:Uncharacterized protein n=1 Tax=Stylosanthes scabra TaxID=79078 RepID=A0ABU6QUD9_9FABA|nr:hypothetical protein [Stylosanthes scabra]